MRGHALFPEKLRHVLHATAIVIVDAMHQHHMTDVRSLRGHRASDEGRTAQKNGLKPAHGFYSILSWQNTQRYRCMEVENSPISLMKPSLLLFIAVLAALCVPGTAPAPIAECSQRQSSMPVSEFERMEKGPPFWAAPSRR